MSIGVRGVALHTLHMQAIIKVLPWSCQRIPWNGSYRFLDQATLHNSRYINRHDCKILRSGTAPGTIEHQHDSPKINIWLRTDARRYPGPVHLCKTNNIKYWRLLWHPRTLMSFRGRKMLEQNKYFFSLLQQLCRSNLDVRFPNRWIGKARSISWPQRSPTIITQQLEHY